MDTSYTDSEREENEAEVNSKNRKIIPETWKKRKLKVKKDSGEAHVGQNTKK